MKGKLQAVQLRDVVLPTETRNPRIHPKASFSYVDIASVSNKEFRISSAKEILGEAAPSRARKVIRCGDVLVATTRPYLRTIAQVPLEMDNQICSTGFCVLRSQSKMLPEWLFLFCLSEEFIRQIVPLMRGANYPAVTDKDILNALIPLPPLPEQLRIVARIKECMERVEEIEKLRAEAQSESQLLSPVLIEAIESSGDWPTMPIENVILSSKNGRSISADTSGSATGFILSLGCVRNVTLSLETKKPIKLANSIAQHFPVKKGDVFVSRSNTRDLVGLASVAEQSGQNLIYPDLLIKLEADTKLIHPRFLAYSLRTRSSRKQIQARAVGTSQSMVKISASRLKEVKIKVPPLFEQERLLQKLDYSHELIGSVSDSVSTDDTAHLRDAILRKAFAGEL